MPSLYLNEILTNNKTIFKLTGKVSQDWIQFTKFYL